MDLNIDEIIKCYFKQKNILVNHQLKSYDEFIEKILPNIIYNYFPIQMNFESDKIKKIIINVSNINIGKPFTTENNGYSNLMYPNIARLRNYSYMASVIVDFESTIYINDNGVEIELEKNWVKLCVWEAASEVPSRRGIWAMRAQSCPKEPLGRGGLLSDEVYHSEMALLRFS